jgi:hypothetical protein
MIVWGTALAAGLMPSVALAQTSASDDAAAAAGLSLFTLFSSFMCLTYAVGAVLVVGSLVLWLIVLVDLIQRTDGEFPSAMAGQTNTNEKVVWLLVVLLAGSVGALIYYLSVMRKVPRARGNVPMGPGGAPMGPPS